MRARLAASVIALGAIGMPTLAAHDRPDVRVIVTGLNDPRGLAFDRRGDLYIAEAGAGGGTRSTVGLCDQIQPPLGPAVGGTSGRISRLERNGALTTVAAGLPSTEASPLVGGDKQGVADVAIADRRLVALISGAGCSHGHARANNGIVTFGRHGMTMLADLSRWLLEHPGAKGAEQPRNPDYEPDGTWYSMLVHENHIYAVEPNHGLLISVGRHDGRIELVSDLFARFGDHTYTALATDRDDLYVGTLGQIVFGPGGPDLVNSFDAGIYVLPRHGRSRQFAAGLRAVVGIAFDERHRLYALQSPIFVPGTGSLVRVNPNGSIETLVSGLVFPSSLTRGPDRAFYISECGFHCGPGDGRILRVDID